MLRIKCSSEPEERSLEFDHKLASKDLPALRDFLRDHLVNNIIAFWLKHGIDGKGGLNTCLNDDGSVVSYDKWLWSQWRAVWVFSTMYRMVDPNPKYLEVARHIFDFCVTHGWNEQKQAWNLLLDRDGSVKRECESIYVDGFAMYGATALAMATGDKGTAEWATRTADSVLKRLEQKHENIPHFPYEIPKGARVHGLPMIFSLLFWELGEYLDETKYRDATIEMQRDVFQNFYKPSRDLLLERIADDNSEFPPPLGTAVNPGHVIEDMWFQIHIARDRGDDEGIAACCKLIKRHCEAGWDDEFGGLFLAIDADGRSFDEVGWDFADTKIWWPHTEALYALLLAYEHTGEKWCLDWYDMVHDYTFKHFPSAEHGEWIQKLDRRGNPMTDVVALPVKDPFHLPRALIYCVDTLERVTSGK